MPRQSQEYLDKLTAKRIVRFNRILNISEDFMNIEELFEALRNISLSVLRKDCKYLAQHGYLAFKKNMGTLKTVFYFKALKPSYDEEIIIEGEEEDEPDSIKPLKIEVVQITPTTKQIKLTDNAYWTKAATRTRSPWIGTTLGTMSYE